MTYTNINYFDWKILVHQYINKIITCTVDDIKIDLLNLYLNNYHPYTAAIIAILQTDQYKQNKFNRSFVIPYSTELVIVEV